MVHSRSLDELIINFRLKSVGRTFPLFIFRLLNLKHRLEIVSTLFFCEFQLAKAYVFDVVHPEE